VINLIKGGHFSGGDKDTFRPLLDNLLNNDPFCVFADFDDYLNAQDAVNEVWKNRDEWNNMSLLNIARSGFFSSDRSIRDYCDKIWGISV
jgi:starch phosphorylase